MVDGQEDTVDRTLDCGAIYERAEADGMRSERAHASTGALVKFFVMAAEAATVEWEGAAGSTIRFCGDAAAYFHRFSYAGGWVPVKVSKIMYMRVFTCMIFE